MNKNELEIIVNDWYKSIVMCKDLTIPTDDGQGSDYYKNFPWCKCDSGSELTHKFLHEEIGLMFNFVFKEKNIGDISPTHVYLINENYLVDISISQFDFIKGQVTMVYSKDEFNKHPFHL